MSVVVPKVTRFSTLSRISNDNIELWHRYRILADARAGGQSRVHYDLLTNRHAFGSLHLFRKHGETACRANNTMAIMEYSSSGGLEGDR
jgi:hypothetical protein